MPYGTCHIRVYINVCVVGIVGQNQNVLQLNLKQVCVSFSFSRSLGTPLLKWERGRRDSAKGTPKVEPVRTEGVGSCHMARNYSSFQSSSLLSFNSKAVHTYESPFIEEIHCALITTAQYIKAIILINSLCFSLRNLHNCSPQSDLMC